MKKLKLMFIATPRCTHPIPRSGGVLCVGGVLAEMSCELLDARPTFLRTFFFCGDDAAQAEGAGNCGVSL